MSAGAIGGGLPAGAYTPEQLEMLEEITIQTYVDDMVSDATDEIGGDDDDD